jgi:membrane protein YdbS with pleckstrin-like domain
MKEFELNPGEKVVKEVRKHWFVFLVELLPFAILALLPFVLPKILLLIEAPDSLLFSWSTASVQALLALWWLCVWTLAFNIFTQYYLDLWVITSERIVDVDQRGFFNRQVSSLLLNRVQDVTVDQRGILYSLLDIGTISLQTAGATTRFHMKGVPHPSELRDAILQNVAEHPLPTEHI